MIKLFSYLNNYMTSYSLLIQGILYDDIDNQYSYLRKTLKI